MRTFINTCGIVLTIILLLTFAKENSQTVHIKFYQYLAYDFPAWGLILIPFFLGIIAGNLLDVVQCFRLKNEIRRLKKEIKGMNPQ